MILPEHPLLLSADTPIVSRSPHVQSASGYVMDGSMFADGRLRVVLAESTSSAVVDAVRESLEERVRRDEAVVLAERLLERAGRPEDPYPVLLPWQKDILARVASGEPLTIREGGRSHGRSFVDRVLAEVCPACRTVGGHSPTCVTRVGELLDPLTKNRTEGDIS